MAAVIIESVNEENVCVLYPPDATDEQLETMWILAEGEATYVHVDEIR